MDFPILLDEFAQYGKIIKKIGKTQNQDNLYGMKALASTLGQGQKTLK